MIMEKFKSDSKTGGVKNSKVLRLSGILLIIFGMLLGSFVAIQRATADINPLGENMLVSGVGQTYVKFSSKGSEAWTMTRVVNFPDGRKGIAICNEPGVIGYPAPGGSKVYNVKPVNMSSKAAHGEMLAMIYYYGASGFATPAEMNYIWQNVPGEMPNPNGIDWQAMRYSITHIMLADTFNTTSKFSGEFLGINALDANQQAFYRHAVKDHVGIQQSKCLTGDAGNNPKTVYDRMWNQWCNNLSQGMRNKIAANTFIVNEGSPDGAQSHTVQLFTPRVGAIDLQKTSAMPQYTDGNNPYSFAGAEYGLFKDAGLTQMVHKFVTDAKGKAPIRYNLPCGWYYLKELKAPSNGSYHLNPAVLSVPSC